VSKESASEDTPTPDEAEGRPPRQERSVDMTNPVLGLGGASVAHFQSLEKRASMRLTLVPKRAGFLSAVVLLACACATPIGVTRVDTQVMYRSVTSSVLSSNHPSQYSEQLLTRLGLGERFDKDPELVLAALRGPGEGLSREYLYVLSELSFHHAARARSRSTFSPPPRTRGPSCLAGRTRRASTRSTRACGWRPTSTIWASLRGLRSATRQRS